MRLQLALNVKDMDRAVEYYSRLFGVVPHKRKPGYANFAIDQPPLKLVLFENPGAADRLNHLGVEVFEAQALNTAALRLRESGITDSDLATETCCHAVQDKVWSTAPDGEEWEWYRITDDSPAPAHDSCCT